MAGGAALIDLDRLGNRELAAFDVSGERIAIASVGGAFYGFGATCTHLGVLAR